MTNWKQEKKRTIVMKQESENLNKRRTQSRDETQFRQNKIQKQDQGQMAKREFNELTSCWLA